MVSKKPRIVIIGAGMAGLTAANKLCKSTEMFEVSIVEGGSRIGGRINTSEFSGDRVELGATWIHGIGGSPVHKIAAELGLLESEQPWECMDGAREDPVTIAEGGHVLSPSLVDSVSRLFENLMNFVQGKAVDEEEAGLSLEVMQRLSSEGGDLSVGGFLRRGLEAYWEGLPEEQEVVGNWSRRRLEEAIFAMNESVQRTFTSADDLRTLDYNAEKEYVMFPGEEITIARGYSSVVESLASALPEGMIQLGRIVEKIEWQSDGCNVKLHFSDGSVSIADHVIVTVSLGVLKRGIGEDCGLFEPPLPPSKTAAISRLGYGVVNKVFLQLAGDASFPFPFPIPFLQMAFHKSDSQFRNPSIPNWMRKTSFVHPIYQSSRVLLSWFTGQEALELETLDEDEIVKGFSATLSNLLSKSHNPTNCCHSNGSWNFSDLKFGKVLRSQWGSNPLFLGSYSYIAVGSSSDDIDLLAEPLPELQILFAGEATHRTHYSTTHGAYFSGLREANRLLKHYHSTAL